MTDDDQTLIAYCGLYCGDCASYKGEIADLARDLRKALRDAKFERYAEGLSGVFKEYRDYDKCYATLGAMVRMRCGRGCRNGGGNPGCAIRKCCVKKGFAGCWECADSESCDRFSFLKTIHGEATDKNLRRLKTAGTAAFVKGKRDW